MTEQILKWLEKHTFIDKQITSKQRKILTFISVIIYIIFLVVFYTLHQKMYGYLPQLAILMPIYVLYLFSKIIFSTYYKKAEEKYKNKNDKVAILIPFFNEDVESIKKQLTSIRDQKHKNFNIYYCDDFSNKKDAYNWLKENLDENKNEFLLQNEKNLGKRESQVRIIEEILKLNHKIDFFYTTDSDTILTPDTLIELLKQFNNDEVVACSGIVLASNAKQNLLTKIVNTRYFNAFENERAAQSVTASVIVNSGPNSMYRSYILFDNIDEYKNQYFLGKKQYYGDDRALTNISLKYGKVKYQSSSIVYTEIPSTFKKFTKQQIRWGKSFIRESYLGIKNAVSHKLLGVSLWILLEIIMIPVYYYSIGYVLYSLFTLNTTLLGGIWILLTVLINSWIRNLPYIFMDKYSWFLTPIYGFIHVLWVTPLKIYSFIKIKDTGWGTR